MQLTQDDLREFIELWREEFGETISEGEARHYASRLLELAHLLSQRPPQATDSGAIGQTDQPPSP